MELMQGPTSNIEQFTEIELRETVLGCAPWQGGDPNYREGAAIHTSVEQRGNTEVPTATVRVEVFCFATGDKMLLTLHYEQKKEAAKTHLDPECALTGSTQNVQESGTVPPGLETLVDEDETGEGYATGDKTPYIGEHHLRCRSNSLQRNP